MIGLLGALGGAAAVELSKLRRSRGKGDPQQVHKLKEREQQLERIIAELEQDKKSLHQASDDKASELLNTLAAAQEEVERVKAEKASLEGEHKTLKTQATLLAVHATQLAARGNLLQQEANQLTRANKLLAEQCERLQLEQEDQHNLLEGLRDQVSAVLNRFFNNEIDASELIAEVREMGCEIQYDDDTLREASAPEGSSSFDFGSKYVLDSPGKMRHLIQACIKQAPMLPAAAEAPMLATLKIPDMHKAPGELRAGQFSLAWRGSLVPGQGASSSGQAGALERGAVQQPAAPRLERGPTPRDAPGAQPDTNKAQAPSIVAAAPEAVPLSSAATKKAAIAQNGYLTFSSPQKEKAPMRSLNLMAVFGGSGHDKSADSGMLKAVAGGDDALFAPSSRDLAVKK